MLKFPTIRESPVPKIQQNKAINEFLINNSLYFFFFTFFSPIFIFFQWLERFSWLSSRNNKQTSYHTGYRHSDGKKVYWLKIYRTTHKNNWLKCPIFSQVNKKLKYDTFVLFQPGIYIIIFFLPFIIFISPIFCQKEGALSKRYVRLILCWQQHGKLSLSSTQTSLHPF